MLLLLLFAKRKKMLARCSFSLSSESSPRRCSQGGNEGASPPSLSLSVFYLLFRSGFAFPLATIAASFVSCARSRSRALASTLSLTMRIRRQGPHSSLLSEISKHAVHRAHSSSPAVALESPGAVVSRCSRISLCHGGRLEGWRGKWWLTLMRLVGGWFWMFVVCLVTWNFFGLALRLFGREDEKGKRR